MKNYSYVATKHNQINFRNRAFNDKEMINSLSQIIRPNDLMNSIIYYFIKISDNYVVNTPSNESMKLLDALSDASHLHVLYLKKNNDNSFRFYIDFMFDLKTSIKIDELTLTTDDAIEVTVHSRSGFNCYFTKFYYRQNDDVTYDQFKGNNFGITMDTGDTEHFYIETYIYFPSGESLGYEVTKNN
jgi:hypothetical protein